MWYTPLLIHFPLAKASHVVISNNNGTRKYTPKGSTMNHLATGRDVWSFYREQQITENSEIIYHK